MRTIVDIPEKDLKELDRLCKKENISRTEKVRRLIRDYLQDNLENRRNAFFGIWKNIPMSDVELDKIKKEWY